jgi:hypothetical protein
LVEVDVAGRAVEGGVPEGEDAAAKLNTPPSEATCQ